MWHLTNHNTTLGTADSDLALVEERKIIFACFEVTATEAQVDMTCGAPCGPSTLARQQDLIEFHIVY